MRTCRGHLSPGRASPQLKFPFVAITHAVSRLVGRLLEDFEALAKRDLSELKVRYIFLDGVVSAGADRERSGCWPGNIRELENVVERAVILSPAPELELAAELIPPVAAPSPPGLFQQTEHNAVRNGDSNLGEGSLAGIEKQHIISILKQTNWRIDGPNGAAAIIKLNSSTLRSRIKSLYSNAAVTAFSDSARFRDAPPADYPRRKIVRFFGHFRFAVSRRSSCSISRHDSHKHR